MKKLIIAIDGPVGSGKSTLARRVAEILGYTYLDTGAMYRALALKAIRTGAPLDDEAALESLATVTRIDLVGGEDGHRVLLDREDVSDAIRTPDVGQAASKAAVLPGVRRVLVAEQRRAGAAGGVVMEGRDVGTVIFPNAELKIFLDASVEARAERRWREYLEKGEKRELAGVEKEVRERDQRDKTRAASPLVRAKDAVIVDNSAMDAEETARLVALLAREREAELKRKAAP
ncbi:MAG TPA: (d)CMP kinase [Candidatus Acidoferrales bacterium]|nr:(d)CMP kinase [Candidatus Acidoferrales bacterium]